MTYKTIKEALESKQKYLIINDDEKFLKHFRKWDFFNNQDEFLHRNFGRFFLYEEVISAGRGKARISYPKLAIYINERVIDQVIQIDYIDYSPRTWEINSEYTTQHEGKLYNWSVCERETEINSLILWGNSNLLVYGGWNGMPNWKELKVAYRETWWFHRDIDEMRDLKIDSLLR